MSATPAGQPAAAGSRPPLPAALRAPDAAGTQVVKDITDGGGRACYRHLDVTSQPEWEAAVAAALEEFGRLDILVNNAGLGDLAVIEHTSLEDWSNTIGIDQAGVFLGMKTASAALAASGHGSVINISSIFGTSGGSAPRRPTTRPRARSAR